MRHTRECEHLPEQEVLRLEDLVVLFARVACSYMVCWEIEEINSTSMFTVNQVTLVPEVGISVLQVNMWCGTLTLFMFALSSIFTPKDMPFITTRQDIDCKIVLEIIGLRLLLFFPQLCHASRMGVYHTYTCIHQHVYMTASVIFRYIISQLMIIPLGVS